MMVFFAALLLYVITVICNIYMSLRHFKAVVLANICGKLRVTKLLQRGMLESLRLMLV